MCKIFFIFFSMSKVKYYCQFKIMKTSMTFIFYLSRMTVYVVEYIYKRIECCNTTFVELSMNVSLFKIFHKMEDLYKILK